MEGVTNIELLERELYLKTLQIRSLLYITQSINNNVSAEELFNIYKHTLGFELQITKMVLFFKIDEKWQCVSEIDAPDGIVQAELTEEIMSFTRIAYLNEKTHPLLDVFDIVVPVFHKQYPIAFTFIGGLGDNDNAYEKMQFVSTITSIIAVAIENKRLFKKQIEQERATREMELAGDVQSMLLPSKYPVNDWYELDGQYKPHQGVGGDYFDFFELEDDNLLFCIADISGKGVAAALLMSNFQANLGALVTKDIKPKDFIQDLNKSVLRITEGEKFITFFIAKYCRRDQKLTYVNAGHNPPILLTKNKIVHLDKGCTILGYFDEIPEIEVGEIYINDETLILTYTDGLTDQTNNEEVIFDIELLEDYVQDNAHLSVKEFNEKLMSYIEKFRGQVPYTDDIALLTCKIYSWT